MSYANGYVCDLSGQITRIRRTPTVEGVALGIESDEVAYRHDAAGRLLKHYEARQGHSRAQFSYDAADNLAANDDPAPVTDNRLQHWQALFMKYDHWGNLVSRRNGLYEQHYAYDAENRLVSARGTGPEGRFEARYHYDALGRRTRKIVTTTHGTTDTRFLWQGYRLLQEQQASGLCSTYIYDPNEAWSPLARVDHLRDQSSGEIYWINTDLNGAPLEVTDERGAVRWSGQYGSFGEVRHQSEGFSRLVNRSAMAHQPLRYAGQYADGETGLHYNLFRYYDPQVGRFIVQDPIGLNGGWNLYQYAPNPLGWIDPLGLLTYNTMPSITGFQKHHIIPQQLKGHDLIKAADFNIHDIKNVIYLPKSADYHPTRTIHSGSHLGYTKNIGDQMDAIYEYGKENGWKQAEYKQAVSEIIKNERADLRGGKNYS